MNIQTTTFYVVINSDNKIVWRDIGMSQGAAYGCAYTSKGWAEKKAKHVGGFVYKVQGLYLPDFDRLCESDHDKVAKDTPFYN